jgi:hypothetical protein
MPRTTRQWLLLFVAGITILQLGIATAGASRLCCALGECDVTMQCYVAPSSTVMPVPSAAVETGRPAETLLETLPPQVVGQLPQGKLADIWRPPPFMTDFSKHPNSNFGE